GPRYEVGESSTAGTARQVGPTTARTDLYGFTDMLEDALGHRMSRELGYGISDTWDDLVGAIQEIAPTTLEGVNQRVIELATKFDQEDEIIYSQLDDGARRARLSRAALAQSIGCLAHADHRSVGHITWTTVMVSCTEIMSWLAADWNETQDSDDRATADSRDLPASGPYDRRGCHCCFLAARRYDPTMAMIGQTLENRYGVVRLDTMVLRGCETVFRISNCHRGDSSEVCPLYFLRGIALTCKRQRCVATTSFQELALLCDQDVPEETDKLNDMQKIRGSLKTLLEITKTNNQTKGRTQAGLIAVGKLDKIPFEGTKLYVPSVTSTITGLVYHLHIINCKSLAPGHGCRRRPATANNYTTTAITITTTRKSNNNNNNRNNKNPRAQGANTNAIVFFECGAPGHFKKDCPQWKNKNQGNGNAVARAYAVGVAEHNPDNNVVTAPTTLDHGYNVELADGRIIWVNTPLLDCAKKIRSYPFGSEIVIVQGDGSRNKRGTRLTSSLHKAPEVSATSLPQYLSSGEFHIDIGTGAAPVAPGTLSNWPHQK
ncbi:putative reverse transcriptase domain-containing protein, partial [Tanacetum coccineum]